MISPVNQGHTQIFIYHGLSMSVSLLSSSGQEAPSGGEEDTEWMFPEGLLCILSSAQHI